MLKNDLHNENYQEEWEAASWPSASIMFPVRGL